MKLPSHKRFGPLLTAVCGISISATANAAISYSGLLDIGIPTNFAGIYVDIGTGGTSEPVNDPPGVQTDSYRIGYSEPGSWDVNFFFGGIGIAYSDTFQPFVDDTVGNRAQILNVAPGTVISNDAAARTVGVASYGGSGTSNGVTAESHFDTPTVDSNPAYSAFTPASQGYIAFVLNPGGSEQYGWMLVTLTNDGNPGVIHEWAYSDEASFEVGQIPEPGTAGLLLLAASGLLRRRRVG